jgi:hypothetical protein
MSERTPAGSSTHGHNLARLIFDHCSDRLGWHAQAWELAGKVMIEESIACCAGCGHTRDRHVGNDKHEESCDEDGCGCVVFARTASEVACGCTPVARTGGGHDPTCPEWQAECTCYELHGANGGHQPGCYFHAMARAEAKTRKP